MENLKPPFGLEFGQEIYTVINDVKKIAGAFYYESQSDINRVTFLYLKISGRKCETIFYFFERKLCKVKFLLSDHANVKKMIKDYNQIKSEINAKYYITENDFIEFEPPAYETEKINDEYEYNLKKELIEYTAFWNFNSDTEFDDYIFLKIDKELRIVITYEHGDLNNKFLQQQKSEW